MTALAIVALILAIWFTFINIANVVHGQGVPALNAVIMASAWVVFVFTQGWIH